MLNSQWLCIRLDLLGFFNYEWSVTLCSGAGGNAKWIEVISCIQTFLFNYYFNFFLIMCSRHWFDIKFIQLTMMCGFNIKTILVGAICTCHHKLFQLSVAHCAKWVCRFQRYYWIDFVRTMTLCQCWSLKSVLKWMKVLVFILEKGYLNKMYFGITV